MRVVSSTLHVKIKFPTEQGVTVIRGNQQAARQCLISVVNWKQGNQVNQGETTGQLVRDEGTGRSEQEHVEREDASRKDLLKQSKEPREGMGAGCVEELVKGKILPDTNKYFQVGASMSSEERVQVLLFLVQNIDVFAWNPYEVPGVDLGFIVHKLNVDPSYPPKKQKPRRLTKDHV